MKRILMFLVGIIFVSLSGCVTTSLDTSTTTTTSLTTSEDEITYTSEIVPFINFSTEFIKEGGPTEIALYYYTQKTGIPYVDISEFITLLLGIIDENITVESVGTLVTVSLEYFYTEAEWKRRPLTPLMRFLAKRKRTFRPVWN